MLMPFERDRPVVYVLAECTGERLDEREVEFLDIAEDMRGRDVTAYRCPLCKRIHKSLRFFGPR